MGAESDSDKSQSDTDEENGRSGDISISDKLRQRRLENQGKYVRYCTLHCTFATDF
jgi:hypothetical protein